MQADSICMQCPEEAGPQTQKVGCLGWVRRVGEGSAENDCQWVSSWGNESVLDLDIGDGVPPCACTKAH